MGNSMKRTLGRNPPGDQMPESESPVTAAVARHRLLTALTRAYSGVVRAYNHDVRDSGLSFEQWLVLMEIRQNRSMTMGELARALGFNLSTLTRIVDRTVNSSLVYRQVDPDDRRRVVLLLTEDGERQIERIEERLGSALSAESLSGAEARALLGAMARIFGDLPEV